MGSRPDAAGSRTRSPGCAPARFYRPRHPERTALYRLLEGDFEEYERIHPSRYEPRSGPLRRVVRRDVYAYLACGRPMGGFARIRCPRCHAEHLLAFSCRTRNLCPSCQAKRSALFAAWLVEDVLLDVAHRHVVFTVPKRLRGLIERDRRLHGVMARAAWDTLRDALREAACEPDGAPGAVVSLQTFGSFGANFHPHLHGLVTEGVITPDGRFHPVIWPEEADLEERFRRRFLRLLERAGRIRPETRERFLAWRHSGFSVKTTQRLAADERGSLERLARYATRVVLPVGAVELLDGGRVRVETAPDPRTGSTVLEMDRLDLVHAVCQQIPSARMHMIRYLGGYSNRTRRRLRAARALLAGGGGEDVDTEPSVGTRELLGPDLTFEDAPPRPDSAPSLRQQSWARLLRKVFEVDPLMCPRCRVAMEVVACITDPAVIDAILRHRREHGLVSPFEARAPPAA